jgi:hypothetical protein
MYIAKSSSYGVVVVGIQVIVADFMTIFTDILLFQLKNHTNINTYLYDI